MEGNGFSKGDNLKSPKIDRFIAVARSSDTWHQLSIEYKDEIKNRLIEDNGLVCCTRYGFGCGKEFPEVELGTDHVIEIAVGGPVCEIGNMQLLCKDCHRKKTKEHDKRLIMV